MTHFTPDELVDAVEGTLGGARRAHLASCDACTREVADLAVVLREARAVDMPEPSPLFWDHLSARVRTAVQSELQPGGGWPHWLRWPVLAPIGVLALLVLAVMIAVPRQLVPAQKATNETVARDIALADDSWMLVADLVGDLDWDTADAAGVSLRPGTAERAALELSVPEQRELSRLIKAELERVKS